MPTLVHPYTDLDGGRWLRGNLHAHTTHSDGERPTQQVVDDYAQRGYGFLMISDHDIHTSADDLAQVDAKGMILLPGNEISANGPHVLHVGSDARIEPDADRQQIIDAVTGSTGFVVVNHPNWGGNFDHCPLACMRQWQGYVGMEIYNGVISRLPGSPYATNKWDMLLADGRRIWGFANDDSHAAAGDVELGWNVACVKGDRGQDVMDALARGRFYASTGVRITDISVQGTRIRIETDNARRIVALTTLGKRIATADDRAIEVDATQGAGYIRFECWGEGEQFAWTQPFFIED